MHINLWPATWEPSSIKKPSGVQDSAQAQTKLIFEGLQRHLQCRSQMANLMFINRQIFRAVSAMSCFLSALLLLIFKWQIQAVIVCNVITCIHMQTSKKMDGTYIFYYYIFDSSIKNAKLVVYQLVLAHTLFACVNSQTASHTESSTQKNVTSQRSEKVSVEQ